MIRNSWLAMLAAGLFLLLAAEWLLPGAAAPSTRPAPPVAIAAGQAAADTNIVQWGETILARPIFNQDRRPVRPLDTVVSQTLPRLSAIIVIGGSQRAIFVASGEKPQMVAEGDAVGGYVVKSVAPDRVYLSGPDGTVTLRPQFAAAAPSAAIGQ